MTRAPQFSLSLAGETFALVGEQESAPRCDYCGRRAMLVQGKCEACRLQTEIEHRQAEARQDQLFATIQEENR